jgi:hypothetical protein
MPRKFSHSEIIRHLIEVAPACTAQKAAARFGCSDIYIRAGAKKEGVRKEWVREFERTLQRLQKIQK